MEAYALTLARVGYVAVALDFEGHGQNPTPMSGDVTRVDGTTKLLMAEIGRVTDFALALPGVDSRIGFLGHSMASDIVVRQALADPRVAATVAISMFSQAVTPSEPHNLLIITGQWEAKLREDALRNVRLADASATEGVTIGDFSANTGRRAVVAPRVEHVGVLYSETALQETRDWLDAVFDRESRGHVSATGGAIVLLLSGIVMLAWPLSRLWPRGDKSAARAVVDNIYRGGLHPRFADTVCTECCRHAVPVRSCGGLFGGTPVRLWCDLARLTICCSASGSVMSPWFAAFALAAYGILVFGGALDRYVASFLAN